ncbi:MAG: hypothetical protein FWE16_01745 [Firmicutes bacterium]|nr:hypothetical protein [Bacillota bacterium]
MALKPTKQFQFEDLEPWEQELLHQELQPTWGVYGEKNCGQDSSLKEFDAVYGNELINNYAKKTNIKECRYFGGCLSDKESYVGIKCFWETREKE